LVFIQYLQNRCVLSVDLPMDQIILTRAAIDFPGAKYLHITMVWTQIKINRAFFVLVFVVDFFGVFSSGGWGGSSIARGGGPPGWHLWTCCISLYRKMSGSLLKLKDLFIFRVTLNIFYCSILNNRIGHKFYNLETSSPIHTWTYIILYIFHIQWRHKNKIPPMLSVMQMDYPSKSHLLLLPVRRILYIECWLSAHVPSVQLKANRIYS